MKAVAEVIEDVVQEYGSSRKAGLAEAARRVCEERGHESPVACEQCEYHKAYRPAMKGRPVKLSKWCNEQGHHARACRPCLVEVTNVADGSPTPQSLFEGAS